MKALFGQAVFSVGNAEYCWEDVVLAAELWGDWARLRDRVREGIACLRRLDQDEVSIADEDVESAANEFRYARDLVAAQDMEDWLTRWGLTPENWMDYVRWSLLRQRLSAELADLVSEYLPPDEEVDRQMETEAICSGELGRLVHELAGRAAVASNPRGEGDATAVLGQFPSGLRETGLPGISLEACRAKMERLARLELSFDRFRKRALTAEAIRAQIRSRQTEWTRLECQCMSFPEEQMAREATLCAREDGRNLGEIAGDANREMRREQVYVEDAQPAFRDRFLGAQKGELLGPLESGGEFVLYRVLDKFLPSENDPAVVARAEAAILRRLIDREMNDRVKWYGKF